MSNLNRICPGCGGKQVTSFITDHSNIEALLCCRCCDVEEYVRDNLKRPGKGRRAKFYDSELMGMGYGLFKRDRV